MISGISTASAAVPNEGNNKLSISSFTSKAKVPDLGVAHLSAVVSASGKLVRGSGVKSSVPDQAFVGGYIVTFNRNVRNCTYVVSLGNTGSVGVPQPGVISATGANINPNGVYIHANNTDGIPADRFHST